MAEQISYNIDDGLVDTNLPKDSNEEVFTFAFEGFKASTNDDGITSFGMQAYLTEQKLATLTGTLINKDDDVGLNFEWGDLFHINILWEDYQSREPKQDRVYFIQDVPPEEVSVDVYAIGGVINSAIDLIYECCDYLDIDINTLIEEKKSQS